MRVVYRKEEIAFGPDQWFGADQIEPALLDLLPPRDAAISAETMAELRRVSGKGVELEARKLS